MTGPMIDGHPWGWGAEYVGPAPSDWRCECGARSKYISHYSDGTDRCADCARAWCLSQEESWGI